MPNASRKSSSYLGNLAGVKRATDNRFPIFVNQSVSKGPASRFVTPQSV